MASMEDIFEDKRKDILDKVDIILSKMQSEMTLCVSADKMEEGCMVPKEWAKDRANDMMNAVGGRSRMTYSWETTKAGKLLDAETSLRGMKYHKVGQFRIRWSHKAYNDMLELLADLASDVRTGKVKMHWPKYESLVEEAVSKFFDIYDIDAPGIQYIPIRIFSLIGIDTLQRGYRGISAKSTVNEKENENLGDTNWNARSILRDEIKEGKWDKEFVGPDGNKKYHFLFE